jgi:hypothetical protein
MRSVADTCIACEHEYAHEQLQCAFGGQFFNGQHARKRFSLQAKQKRIVLRERAAKKLPRTSELQLRDCARWQCPGYVVRVPTPLYGHSSARSFRPSASATQSIGFAAAAPIGRQASATQAPYEQRERVQCEKCYDEYIACRTCHAPHRRGHECYAKVARIGFAAEA